MKWEVVEYTGIALMIVGLVYSGLLPGWILIPALALVGAFFISEFLSGRLRLWSRAFGTALAFILTGKAWGVGGAIASLGTGLFLEGSREGSMLKAGTGEFLIVLAPAFFIPVEFSPIPILSAVFLLLGYILALKWRELEGSVLAFPVIGGAIGLYLSLRPLLSGGHKLVPYVEWLALILATLFTAGVVLNAFHSPEEYLPELVQVEAGEDGMSKAVKDFLLWGKRDELLSILAFYGSRVLGSRKELEELIRPIVEYEPRRPGPLTPYWLRKRILTEEVQKRKEIVEKTLSRLEGLL